MTLASQARGRHIALESAFLHDDYALEQAALSGGEYPVRIEHGRIVRFQDVGGVLMAQVTKEAADYLEQIPGFEIEGRPPFPHKTPQQEEDFMELGRRLAEERENGKQKKADSLSNNALVDALIASIGGRDALLGLLAPQLAPQLAQAAEVAKVQQAAEQAEAEEKRGWRYSDLAGKVDPEDALILLEEYPEGGVNLGALSDSALLSRLAKKANEFPALDRAVRNLLNGAE